MPSTLYSWKHKILALIVISATVFAAIWYWAPICETIKLYYGLLADNEKIQAFISSFDHLAPLIFIAVQILQVLLAPFPGEATGFAGGYLFGTIGGFIYSSIGLVIGSVINFLIGRLLGKRYIRKVIPDIHLERFDNFVKHQGIWVLFVLFLFPGFPKDYLCLFLGFSALPIRVFIILTAIGRMPGTFILSLQGASLFEKNYAVFALLLGFCLLMGFVAYRYREKLYGWIDRLNNRK
jgi:uncharacterized membrane protein YdjX (TVP38/TMEM64 family)